MIRPQRFDALSLQLPNKPAGSAVARDVKHVARAPSQFGRKRSQGVEKSPAIVESEPPFCFRNPRQDDDVRVRARPERFLVERGAASDLESTR